MKKGVILSLLSFVLFCFSATAQLVTIEDINVRFNALEHEEVVFEGYIERYVAGTAATSSYYEIKGEYGARLRVNTTQPSPQINQRYRVTGTVTIHNGSPLIIERSKSRVMGLSLNVTVNPREAGSVAPSSRSNLQPGESVSLSATPARNYKFDGWSHDNRSLGTDLTLNFQMPESSTTVIANFKRDWTLYIIGGIVIALILIVIIILVIMKKPKQQPSFGETDFTSSGASPGMGTYQPPVDPGPGGVQSDTVRINIDQDYSTVKLQQSAPSTVKFIPGELEILNGLDKGKSFKMAGYPTSDGNVATIGRDHDGWQNLVPVDRHYAHIRLKDESNTLSRMQAELVHRVGKLYLKNLSKVNPAQVDGEDVPVNEVVEVKPGSVIKAGFIEFKYKV